MYSAMSCYSVQVPNQIKFDGISSVGATATVIGGLFESGIDSIVEDKYAFVNFDEDFIHSDSLELIGPPNRPYYRDARRYKN